MGDLIRTPHSEITATLELLDRHGVTREDFERLRKASSWQQDVTARVIKNDPFLLAMLAMEQLALKVGLTEVDFRDFAGNEEKMKEIFVACRNYCCSLNNFPIFLPIQLGTHPSIKALRQDLKNNGHSIGNWANDILGRITLASTPTTLNLVVVSNADLGLLKGARFEETCAKAKELGLDLCPAEVGPQLRLQYKDQPRGEWLVVAMEPIKDSGGYLDVFDVERDEDGESWLVGSDGNPSGFWHAGRHFVFVSRR